MIQKVFLPGITFLFASLILLTISCNKSDENGSIPTDLSDKEAIKNAIANFEAAFESENLANALSYLSDNFLNNGRTKSDEQAWLQEAFAQFDCVITFSNLSITINQNYATVSGHIKIEDDFEIFADEDFGPHTIHNFWGIFWIKENSNWKMYGNQQRSSVDISIQHYYLDNYFLGISVEGQNIDTVTVTGPNITSVWLNQQDPDHTVASLSVRPNIGDTYIIRINFDDGTHEDISYSVNGVNDNFAWIITPANGGTVTTTTPTFTWQAASNIETYHLKVTDDQNIWIWQPFFSVGTTTCVYNYDGSATAPLQSGKTYGLTIHTFDSSGNQASTTSNFSVQ